jgi:hypothetical protein
VPPAAVHRPTITKPPGAASTRNRRIVISRPRPSWPGTPAGTCRPTSEVAGRRWVRRSRRVRARAAVYRRASRGNPRGNAASSATELVAGSAGVVGVGAAGLAREELCLRLGARDEVLAIVAVALGHALRRGRRLPSERVDRLPRERRSAGELGRTLNTNCEGH